MGRQERARGAGGAGVGAQGVSDRQGDLLEEAFGIKTVADLADLKYVGWAQALAALDAAK